MKWNKLNLKKKPKKVALWRIKTHNICYVIGEAWSIGIHVHFGNTDYTVIPYHKDIEMYWLYPDDLEMHE